MSPGRRAFDREIAVSPAAVYSIRTRFFATLSLEIAHCLVYFPRFADGPPAGRGSSRKVTSTETLKDTQIPRMQDSQTPVEERDISAQNDSTRLHDEHENLLSDVRECLASSLQLGDRTAAYTIDTPLLGHVPELDSMAVLTLIGDLEDRFGFTVDDDEISAETFASVGSLVEFVQIKLS